MKNHLHYINKAIEVAKTSKGFNSKNPMGAIIVVGKQIIAKGVNSEKTHPLACTFSRHPEAIYLHAEIDAIIKASRILSKQDWKKSSIYIARVTKEGYYGQAKPCDGCAAAIAHFGITKVGYTLTSDQLDYVTYHKGNFYTHTKGKLF